MVCRCSVAQSKPLLDQPCPSFLLLCHCARMGKSAKAKSKAIAVAKVRAAPKSNKDAAFLSNLAAPFRNLMKYRASDQCKKAFSVIMRS